MGRGKIAETSEIAHFRVDTKDKRALKAKAKTLGKKKKFSDLARDAIKKYIETLREEELLSGGDEFIPEGVETPFSFTSSFRTLSQALSDLENSEINLKQWTSKRDILGFQSYSDMLRELDALFDVFRKTIHDFPWGSSPELLDKFPLEVASQILALKLGWVRQTLLFFHWMHNWHEQKKQREERESAAMELIAPIKRKKKD